MRINLSKPRARSAATLVLLFALSACVQSTKITLEYINPPVNLSIAAAGAGTYQLSFFSDNREGGFAGYGIFTGPTAAQVTQYPANDITSAPLFCVATTQTNYKTQVTIQVGPLATGATLCNLTGLTLTSGQFVAVRARVERLETPWSEAAIVQVP